MKRMVSALAGAVLLATGCTGGGASAPASNPTSSTAPTSVAIPAPVRTAWPSGVEKSPATMVPAMDGTQKPSANAELIAPNETIVASMTCEPVSEDNARILRDVFRANPAKAIQVTVGQFPDGTTYYVLVAPDHQNEYEHRAYMPVVVGDHDDQWYNLAAMMRGPVPGGWNYAWDLVYWGADDLERGQSALAKAFDCLSAPRYQTEGAILRG